MIPENDQKRNDAIDFLVEGMQDMYDEKQPDGTIKRTYAFNSESAWYKGHTINQPFGRCALHLKRVGHLAKDCYNFMSYDRAEEMHRGLLLIEDDYKRSIDAKSSETYKDEHNTQSSLVHILSKNKIEKQITLKGDGRERFMDGFFGKKGQEEED